MVQCADEGRALLSVLSLWTVQDRISPQNSTEKQNQINNNKKNRQIFKIETLVELWESGDPE